MSTGVVSGDGLYTARHVVHRASDGHPLLNVGLRSSVAAVWETDATLLFVKHARAAGSPYQVVRCTLSGHCATVGSGRSDPGAVRAGDSPQQLSRERLRVCLESFYKRHGHEVTGDTGELMAWPRAGLLV